MVDSKENYKFDLGIKGLKISKKENYVTALRNESERVKFRKGNNKMNERSKKNYFLSGFGLYLVKCRTTLPTCEVTWESWISTNREKQRINNRETSVLSLFCVCNLTFNLQ